MLLKHVAVRSQVCLPARQRVIAAQNKRESVRKTKTDRPQLHRQQRKLLNESAADTLSFTPCGI